MFMRQFLGVLCLLRWRGNFRQAMWIFCGDKCPALQVREEDEDFLFFFSPAHIDDVFYLFLQKQKIGAKRASRRAPRTIASSSSVKSLKGGGGGGFRIQRYYRGTQGACRAHGGVLFIGTQFSNLYTAVDTPARGRVGGVTYLNVLQLL